MLSYKLKGIKDLAKKGDKVRGSLNKRREINAKAVVLLDRWIQKNFQTQGKLAEGGSGWKPLKEATILRRRKGPRPGSPKILQDTGTMKSRWKHIWSAKLAGIQSGVNYSKFHDKGTRRGLPRRKITPMRKQIWPEVVKLYGKWMGKILR